MSRTCSIPSDALAISEKNEQDKFERKTEKEEDEFTEFVVHTFSSKLKTIIVSLPDNCLVADVKSKVGEHLHLNRISLEMFGLFVGPLDYPTQHIPDELTVGDNTEFSLHRVLFWCGNETLITRYDINALDLLYWEMKYIFSGKDKIVECASLFNKVAYVHQIHRLQTEYWKYYYRIPNCILYSQLVIEDCHIPSGTSIQIALGSETLSILNINREVLTSFEWQQVGAVMLEANSKELVKFQVGNGEITVVNKDRGEYLFSLSIHIIKMNEDKIGTRSPHKIVPDRIHDYLVFFNTACHLQSSEETKENMPEDLVMESPLKLHEIKERVAFDEEVRHVVLRDAEGEMELHRCKASGTVTDKDISDGGEVKVNGEDIQDDEGCVTADTVDPILKEEWSGVENTEHDMQFLMDEDNIEKEDIMPI